MGVCVPGCGNEVNDVFNCVDVGQLFPTWGFRQHVEDDLPQRQLLNRNCKQNL